MGADKLQWEKKAGGRSEFSIFPWLAGEDTYTASVFSGLLVFVVEKDANGEDWRVTIQGARKMTSKASYLTAEEAMAAAQSSYDRLLA